MKKRLFSVAAKASLALLPLGGAALFTASPAHAASLSCTKHIGNTVGNITCKTSGGSVYIRRVWADCQNQPDPQITNFTINGSWSGRFECQHKIRGIYVGT
jgi:hypothetical protein